MSSLVPLPRLAADDMQRGGETSLVAEELKYRIMYAAANAPRSLQRRIGPSQIGTPCTRKLAYMCAQTESARVGRSNASWSSIMGTAMHQWLAEAFIIDNENQRLAGHPARWLVETTVDVGTIDGESVTGNADLYDRVTAGVWDWKMVGASTIRDARANGPSATYRTQAQLYGLGFTRRGVPVDYVGIAYLPRTGIDLNSGYFYTEAYDAELAQSALTRANATAYAVRLGAAQILPSLPTADDYCSSCEWFIPGAQVSTSSCPGHGREQLAAPDANAILRG